MLAKLGNMDTATSTNLLTATLNGFNMSADQAVTVVSKLVKFARTHINMWINFNKNIDSFSVLCYN